MDQKTEYLLTKDKSYYPHNQNIPLRSFACSQQSNLVIFGQDNQITVLNRDDLSLIKILNPQKNHYRPASLLFLDNGKSFLCWNNNGTIDLWDIDSETYKTLHTWNDSSIPSDEEPLNSLFVNMLNTHDDPRDLGQVLGINNNLAIISRTKDTWTSKNNSKTTRFITEICSLDIQTGQIKDGWLLNTQYKNIHLTDNLLVCAGNKRVDIYSFDSKTLLKTFQTDFSVHNAKLSHDKTYVICAGRSNLVSIFDFDTEKLIKTVETDNNPVPDFELTSDNHCFFVCEKRSLTCFTVNDQQSLGSVTCRGSPRYIDIDESNQSILVVDTAEVNLIRYTATSQKDTITQKILTATRRDVSYQQRQERPDTSLLQEYIKEIIDNAANPDKVKTLILEAAKKNILPYLHNSFLHNHNRESSFEHEKIVKDTINSILSKESKDEDRQVIIKHLQNYHFTQELKNYDFCGANLTESNFVKIGQFLDNAKFNSAILSGAFLSGASLKHADFTDADLRGTKFFKTNIEFAIFDHSDLRNAIFGDMSSNEKATKISIPQLQRADLLMGIKILSEQLADEPLKNIQLLKERLIKEYTIFFNMHDNAEDIIKIIFELSPYIGNPQYSDVALLQLSHACLVKTSQETQGNLKKQDIEQNFEKVCDPLLEIAYQRLLSLIQTGSKVTEISLKRNPDLFSKKDYKKINSLINKIEYNDPYYEYLGVLEYAYSRLKKLKGNHVENAIIPLETIDRIILGAFNHLKILLNDSHKLAYLGCEKFNALLETLYEKDDNSRLETLLRLFFSNDLTSICQCPKFLDYFVETLFIFNIDDKTSPDLAKIKWQLILSLLCFNETQDAKNFKSKAFYHLRKLSNNSEKLSADSLEKMVGVDSIISIASFLAIINYYKIKSNPNSQTNNQTTKESLEKTRAFIEEKLRGKKIAIYEELVINPMGFKVIEVSTEDQSIFTLFNNLSSQYHNIKIEKTEAEWFSQLKSFLYSEEPENQNTSQKTNINTTLNPHNVTTTTEIDIENRPTTTQINKPCYNIERSQINLDQTQQNKKDNSDQNSNNNLSNNQNNPTKKLEILTLPNNLTIHLFSEFTESFNQFKTLLEENSSQNKAIIRATQTLIDDTLGKLSQDPDADAQTIKNAFNTYQKAITDDLSLSQILFIAAMTFLGVLIGFIGGLLVGSLGLNPITALAGGVTGAILGASTGATIGGSIAFGLSYFGIFQHDPLKAKTHEFSSMLGATIKAPTSS